MPFFILNTGKYDPVPRGSTALHLHGQVFWLPLPLSGLPIPDYRNSDTKMLKGLLFMIEKRGLQRRVRDGF